MPSPTLLTAILATPTLLTLASSNTPYTLTDDLSSTNFFPAFSFYTGPDPTHGFVQYLDLPSAISHNLIGYSNSTTPSSVYLGADSSSSDPAGRASVRLESTHSWNKGLLIADIRHMPAAQCGVWSAFWLLSRSREWPAGGEIDIVEGVNEQRGNRVSLHTGEGCVVENSTTGAAAAAAAGGAGAAFTGTLITQDCDVAALGQDKNAGCSITAPASVEGGELGGGADGNGTTVLLPWYGAPFNDNDGGVYAMEWTADGIAVWFLPRYSALWDLNFSNTTTNFSNTTSAPDPTSWGPPLARFAGSGCDFTQRFADLRIVFNIALCGDWAGREWERACRKKTGVETCEAYVRDHPEAFEEAYWEVAGLKWYARG